MASGADGAIWVVSTHRIWRVGNGRVAVVDASDGWGIGREHLCVDFDGRLWLGGVGVDVLRADGSRVQLTYEDGLEQRNIRSLFSDREGNVWIGTDGGGLLRAKPRPFQVYDERSGLAQSIVDAVIEESPGRLLIGTYGGGLFWLKDGRVTPATEYGSVGGMVLSLLRERDGAVWASSYGGKVMRFAPAPADVPLLELKPPSRVHSLYQDREGTIWMGMQKGGGELSRWRPAPLLHQRRHAREVGCRHRGDPTGRPLGGGRCRAVPAERRSVCSRRAAGWTPGQPRHVVVRRSHGRALDRNGGAGSLSVGEGKMPPIPRLGRRAPLARLLGGSLVTTMGIFGWRRT